MVDEPVVTAVQGHLRALQNHGLSVRFGVVFGSHAAGRADEWSDIDLLVVSPRFDGPGMRKDVDLLWRLVARCDNRIEPIPCGERQWHEDDSSAVVEIARRQGERIAPPE